MKVVNIVNVTFGFGNHDDFERVKGLSKYPLVIMKKRTKVNRAITAGLVFLPSIPEVFVEHLSLPKATRIIAIKKIRAIKAWSVLLFSISELVVAFLSLVIMIRTIAIKAIRAIRTWFLPLFIPENTVVLLSPAKMITIHT